MSDRVREEIKAFLMKWGMPIVAAREMCLDAVTYDSDTRNFFLVVTKTGKAGTERIPVTHVMAHDAMGSGGDAKLREHVENKLYQCFPTE